MAKLPPVSQLLNLFSLKPEKGYSQNFLKSAYISHKFVQQLPLNPNSLVIEIGPGIITRSLLKKDLLKIVGIEKDKRFEPILGQLRDSTNSKFDYILEDATKDKDLSLTGNILQKIGADNSISNVNIIGNLPFSIGGLIMGQYINQSLTNEGLFKYPVQINFMFSEPMGRKLLDNKNRTKFGTMVRTAFTIKESFVIPKASFSPQPQMDVIALEFKPRQSPFNNILEIEYYDRLLQKIYSTPNKKAGATFKKSLDLLQQSGITPDSKLRNAPVNMLVQLSKILMQNKVSL
ncbi:Dimethyladenosine transferase 1, mitochondrial [Boothiomyces sp. JEL0866]|nr:Dimethyladenosine transferase 1, mitochondrial [Boothiomyces sp. JEL0866]